MDAIIQNVASVIKDYYTIRDNAGIAFNGIRNAALTTFRSIDDKVQETALKLKVSLGIRPNVVKSLPKSIEGLRHELKDLERTREVSLNLREINEAGKKIAHVKDQIAKLEKRGGIAASQSAKKTFGGGNLLSVFSKGGTIGMAANGFMKIAGAAGDAEDKRLGIKRDEHNVVIANRSNQDPAQTINGQISAISGGIDGVLGQVGTALQPFITKVLGGFTMLIGMVPNVISALQPLFDVINNIPLGQIFNDLGASIQSVLQALQPVLSALQPLLRIIFSIVADLAHKISDLVSKVMVVLGPALAKIAEVLSTVLGPALESAGFLFGKLLDVIGWVVGKVGSLIDFVKDLFSTVEDGTQKVAETAADKAAAKEKVTAMLKQGQKPEDMAAVYNEIKRTRGVTAANVVLSQYGRFTAELDKQNNTKTNSSQFIKVKEIIKSRSVANMPKTADQVRRTFTPQRDFTPKGTSEAETQGSSITDGGKRSVVINIGKFFDNMNLTAQTMQEGFNDFEHRVEEIFLRIVNNAS